MSLDLKNKVVEEVIQSRKTTNESLINYDLTLPDIARESKIELMGRLDRVGMKEIEVPVLLTDGAGAQFLVPARVNAFVSLDDPQAKGIHMSRLFLQLQDGLTSNHLSFRLLRELLTKFIESHSLLSQSSAIDVAFDYMTQRKALVSANWGWRKYPIQLSATYENGKCVFDLQFIITYSSTCPCSAALARKLIQDHFAKEFKEEKLNRDEIHRWLGSTQGILATPHSQRSLAQMQIRFSDESQFASPKDWIKIIDKMEESLGTPVQAAVKREDEQEFALLNGQNLMFCEDAARKLKNKISEEEDFIEDYRIEVSHLESLHPHNAVSIVTKGVVGGLKP